MFKQKIIPLLCIFVIFTGVLSGCTNQTNGNGGSSSLLAESLSSSSEPSPSPEASPADKPAVRVGALKGPTGLGLVKLMEDNANGTTANQYDFTLAGAPADIQAKLVAGELDIAALPTNLAAVLYNKTDKQVSMLAVNTLGVLYMLTKGEELASFGDLAGKTVYSTGQGAVPEYVLNYLLDKHELTGKVTVEYKSEHAELVGLMAQGKAGVAVLPEPFVTSAMAKDPDIKVAFDLNQIWDNASGGMYLPMGCLVVRNDFLNNNGEAVAGFLEEYRSSTEFVNSNVTEAAALSGKFEVIPAEIAEKAIPSCNIVCQEGDEMRESVNMFLNVLFAANPQSVGGSLPDDALYYKK